MLGNESIAAASGFCSAAAWGAGDFAGGFASRKCNPLTVVLFSQLIGGILLLGLAVFFAFSAHFGRLDVAAILASLYPASTVFLAWWILRERLGVRQWFGVGFTGAALVLIAI